MKSYFVDKAPPGRYLDCFNGKVPFLYSRVPKYGDRVIHSTKKNTGIVHLAHGRLVVSTGSSAIHTDLSQWRVPIGPISAKARWVKVGMEFDEDEWIGWNPVYNVAHDKEYHKGVEYSIVKIKCSNCEIFH